jgi:ATP-binding cassette subfamily B protein/subfamily B ATP-binding cassette protein MsbA
MADAAGSAIRVAEVLDATEAVADASGAVPLEAAVAVRRIASDAADVQRAVRGPLLRARCVRGHVRLEKIVFGYHPDQPVLHDVDLEVRPGELVALTGPSGAGKSTLAALIPRLYDPWRGRVTIDGVDVRAVTLASLRANVAVVLQDPFLLPVSVAENIAYGSAGASRARIEEAARLANADEFVARLSRGYDTPIGEGGATLSGGQRQRLAIARALLRDAPVLVLDEPTSALDPGTEHAVMEALERLTAGRSTLVIAHRASTVSRADRVVVIERGRIVDSTGRFASRARGGPR